MVRASADSQSPPLVQSAIPIYRVLHIAGEYNT